MKILPGIPSECQTVWTLIRPDISLGLIWVQTVCQGYQQTTQVDKELTFSTNKHCCCGTWVLSFVVGPGF